MKNVYVAGIISAAIVVAAAFWLMGLSEQPDEQGVSVERQQQCEAFLTVALFPSGEAAEEFMSACLRGEPVLPGEAGEEPASGPHVGAGCAIGGCSSQICGEQGEVEGMVTTCEWREEYACYAASRCERQASGRCGWTETAEFSQCLTGVAPPDAGMVVY